MIEEVELREIRTFLALTEERHFGRAAGRLGVTPSRVSQTLRTLEARLGGRLFDRTSRSVILTALGEQLHMAVTAPYLQLQEALRTVSDAARGTTGTLRVGMYTESLGGPHLLELIRTFESRDRSVTVALVTTGLERNYLDALRSGEVDLLATRLPLSDPDITIGPILTDEERVLLVAKKSPLARREAVNLEDFADYAVSDAPAFPREMMDELIPPVSPAGRHYRRVVNRTIEDMLLSIAAGRQVHLTVPSFLDYHNHPAVTSVPVLGLPRSKTALVWLTTHHTDRVRAFVAAANEVLDDSAGRRVTPTT